MDAIDAKLKLAKRTPKTMKARHEFNQAQYEETKVRLQQGASIVEIASAFRESPDLVASRLRFSLSYSMAEEVKLLQVICRPRRKGPWSDEETDALVDLRNEGRSLPVISSWLRRTAGNIKEQLIEIEVDYPRPKGPQELPPGLREQLFNQRLISILRGLCKHPMTSKWKDHIFSKALEEWAVIISRSIPDRVKRVLGSLEAPTYKVLMDLPVVCTEDAGVYARLMHRSSNLKEIHRFIYVGSASRYRFGLYERMSQHIHRKYHPRRFNTKLQRLIRRNMLKHLKNFITLMTAEITTSKDISEVRRKVVLAEAIMAIWLGALDTSRSDNESLRSIYPWNLGLLDYSAASPHNPLVVDVVELKDQTVDEGEV